MKAKTTAVKLTIDEKQCTKQNLTLQEVLLALAVRLGDIKNAYKNLTAKEVIVSHAGQALVTQRWSDTLDTVLCDSMQEIKDEQKLFKLAQDMRDCFPEGRMPGTVYYYRCNNREVVLKLKKFFLAYGDYSDEEIIDATKKYIASFRGDYKYLPLIKYFIMKNKIVTDEDGSRHISEVSELASVLENMTDNEIEEQQDDDWTMNIRT